MRPPLPTARLDTTRPEARHADDERPPPRRLTGGEPCSAGRHDADRRGRSVDGPGTRPDRRNGADRRGAARARTPDGDAGRVAYVAAGVPGGEPDQRRRL